MKTLNERLDLIKPKILSDSFRKGRGLGNEINFWIFDYDAEDEMAMRSHIRFLKESIAAERDDTRLMVFDLFDMTVDYLTERGYLDRVLGMELEKKSGAIVNPIKKTLHSTLQDDVLVSRIAADNNPETDIILVCGVGKAWPAIRSHTILNNLHSRVEKTPLVMFFPGLYSDSELKLFGEITDDNYYRAFRLIER
ncbi:MAG: DUF1788 domain-containing protein [Oscillospiraceae bacterium]|nr:DUF1788 domain-containing protein [Oscillospiraceae bacterium]